MLRIAVRARTTLVFISLLLVSSCESQRNESAVSEARIARVIDGDTIALTNDDRVRLIGIDTPEDGKCGFTEAKVALEDLLRKEPVVLVRGTSKNLDKFDRYLRYVEISGIDVGLQLIKAGLAIARYDSRDGYGKHDREAQYVLADKNSLVIDMCK